MADTKKFEDMLEHLVNGDKDAAEDLFHTIVVEKSREIYENLLEDEIDDEEVDEASDEEVDEDSDDEEVDETSHDEGDDDDEELDEDFNLDEFEVEGEDDLDDGPAMGGEDPTDGMMSDIADMGDEEGEGEGEGDVEDRVADLEDALDELKSEFEELMAGEEGEDTDGDLSDMPDDDGEEVDDTEIGPEEEPEEESYNFEASDEEVEEESKDDLTATEQMREYVEKISPAKMGDSGANTKSTVAGANNMGGTASNLVQSGTEAGVESNKGNLKGSALSDQNPKDMNTKNVNVPGGKASKSMTPNAKGHGAEKKGQGDTAANKKPVIG